MKPAIIYKAMSTSRKRAGNRVERLALVKDLPSEIPQSHYKAIFDALPSLLLVLTPDFRMAAANHARFHGTMSTPEEVIGKTVFEIFPDNPADPKATGVTNLRASLERVLALRIPDRMAIQRYDIPLPSSEGGGFEERYWSPLNTPVLNEMGEVQYIIHQVEDVTELVRLAKKEAETTAFNQQMKREIDERRRVELSLIRREQELRMLADSIPQLAWMADPKGNIFWYNRRWYDYTGMTLEETEGWGWKKVHHPDHVERAVELISRHWESGEPWEDTFPLRSRTGEWRWFLARAIPLRDDQGKILRWFGTNTDITEQLLAQEELKKQRTELESERDMREIFVATVSHDLRNPLSTAKMSTQLALRSGDKADAREKYLSRAMRNLERADQMIQNLLDANRLKAGQKLSLEASQCDLRRVASDTLEELSLIHGNRFVLQSPDIVQGYWSCDALRRVFENLCTNAVKYGTPDSPITVTLKPEGERILLSVHNYESVIPKELQTQLFKPFQRAVSSQAKRGWGLGLALVRGLVEAHHGSVGIKSSEAEGTTFTISLPWDSRFPPQQADLPRG